MNRGDREDNKYTKEDKDDNKCKARNVLIHKTYEYLDILNTYKLQTRGTSTIDIVHNKSVTNTMRTVNVMLELLKRSYL